MNDAYATELLTSPDPEIAVGAERVVAARAAAVEAERAYQAGTHHRATALALHADHVAAAASLRAYQHELAALLAARKGA